MSDMIEILGFDAFIERIAKNKELAYNVTGKYDLLLNAITSNDNLKQAVIVALSNINNQSIFNLKSA